MNFKDFDNQHHQYLFSVGRKNFKSTFVVSNIKEDKEGEMHFVFTIFTEFSNLSSRPTLFDKDVGKEDWSEFLKNIVNIFKKFIRIQPFKEIYFTSKDTSYVKSLAHVLKNNFNLPIDISYVYKNIMLTIKSE